MSEAIFFKDPGFRTQTHEMAVGRSAIGAIINDSISSVRAQGSWTGDE